MTMEEASAALQAANVAVTVAYGYCETAYAAYQKAQRELKQAQASAMACRQAVLVAAGDREIDPVTGMYRT